MKPLELKGPDIYDQIWHYAGVDQLAPYLIIMGAGIVLALVTRDKESTREILEDVVYKTGFVLLLYGIFAAIVYFKLFG